MIVYKYFFVAASILMPVRAALAQSGQTANPTGPGITVPSMRYESAFNGYRAYREQTVSSWKEINDESARIGGHIGTLRQSGMPGGKSSAGSASPSPAPSPARPAMPAMPGHGAGH